ncbi:MAG: hypothetical protein IEMM0006_0246 [bacterium]|nr:MAG: hypothetical protein IEMM0006_0246 [bacterium]
MTHRRKQAFFWAAIYFRILYVHFENIIVHIPFPSVAVNGWQLASRAFAGGRKSYRTKQQWKSFFGALINPQFASRWFKILKSPDLLLIATHRPWLYLKPFRVYMSIRWTKKQKIKVILDTYQFILSKGEAFMQVITRSSGVEITRFKLNDTIKGVLTLGYDYRYRKEGELVLFFECNQLGGRIVAAAFSFEELEPGQWACRIGCVQGHALDPDNENLSKTVQKLIYGLRPKSFIVFVVQEFSRQLGLTAVYGVGDSIQAYRRKHLIHLPKRHAIHFDYNAIWSECGGQPDSDGWYELPLTPVRKNIQEVKTNKRALYRRRYLLLDELSLKIADTVKNLSSDGL